MKIIIVFLLIGILIFSGCNSVGIIEEKIKIEEEQEILDNNLTLLGESMFSGDSNRTIKFCDLQITGSPLVEEDKTKWNFYFEYTAPEQFAMRPITYLPVLKSIYDLNSIEDNSYCFVKVQDTSNNYSYLVLGELA